MKDNKDGLKLVLPDVCVSGQEQTGFRSESNQDEPRLQRNRTFNREMVTFGTDPEERRRLYLQNKSLSVEGDFQSVDGVAVLLTQNTARSASSFPPGQPHRAPAPAAWFPPELQQKLTLLFSNFQLSSWVRICSTTDMASRPCFTYSFSCR